MLPATTFDPFESPARSQATKQRGSNAVIRVGNLTLDRERREAYLGEKLLSLTYQEFEVLCVLLGHQNSIISHTAICRAIWGEVGQQALKRLAVVISNLRRKLSALSPYKIETVRSRGYGVVLRDADDPCSPDPIGVHDWHSHAYVREWIGRQDDSQRVYLRQLVSLLPFDRTDPIRVLDIGAGYGVLTRLILNAFPNSTVVLHDSSEPMLREARAYLSGASDAVSFVRGDLLTDEWTRDIGGRFDAVVSAIALHNVRHPERIRSVYRDISSLLVPGGCFLNADYVRAEAPRSEGIDGEDGVVLSLAQRAGEAMLLPLEDHLEWLQDAGFDRAECCWQNERIALISATRG